MEQLKGVDSLVLYRGQVQEAWLDYNGHMNVTYYMHVFCEATDLFLDFLGFDQAYRDATNCSTFALESHINYLRELHRGDRLYAETRLLGFDRKKFSYHHALYNERTGELSATTEWISAHVDLSARATCPMPEEHRGKLAQLLEEQRHLPPPLNVGRSIKSWS